MNHKTISGIGGAPLNEFTEFLFELNKEGIKDEDIIAYPIDYPHQNLYSYEVWWSTTRASELND